MLAACRPLSSHTPRHSRTPPCGNAPAGTPPPAPPAWCSRRASSGAKPPLCRQFLRAPPQARSPSFAPAPRAFSRGKIRQRLLGRPGPLIFGIRWNGSGWRHRAGERSKVSLGIWGWRRWGLSKRVGEGGRERDNRDRATEGRIKRKNTNTCQCKLLYHPRFSLPTTRSVTEIKGLVSKLAPSQVDNQNGPSTFFFVSCNLYSLSPLSFVLPSLLPRTRGFSYFSFAHGPIFATQMYTHVTICFFVRAEFTTTKFWHSVAFCF